MPLSRRRFLRAGIQAIQAAGAASLPVTVLMLDTILTKLILGTAK